MLIFYEPVDTRPSKKTLRKEGKLLCETRA